MDNTGLKNRKTFKDLIAIALLSGVVYLLAHVFHLHSIVDRWIDESMVVLAFLGIAFCIFSFRRWMELRHELGERMRIEESLALSEAWFRAIFENAAVGIALIDVEGRPVFSNPALEGMLGYSADELKGKVFAEFTHPDDAHKDADLWRELYEDRIDHYQTEKRYIRKDGRIFWGKLTVSPVKGSDAKKRFAVGMVEDITRHKQAEELMSNILESIDEGFIVIDRDYKIIAANRAFTDSVKMPAEEVIGKYCYEITHHMHRPCYEAGQHCAVCDTFGTGQPHTALHTHYDSAGNPSFIETKSYPLSMDESGNAVSAIEILIDVTERKKLEEQLRHAQKMEAVGQLAGGVAHDFNNILTAMIGYGTMLKMKMSIEDPLRIYAEQILAVSEKAANLTQGLLAFSRKQPISLYPASLKEIVKSVEKLLFRVIGENIEIRTVVSDKDLTVMADRGQIEQMLVNLATNARDAMPEGGILTIETGLAEMDEGYVRAHGYGRAGAYALLSVTDTGIGMDEKTRGKIFEPFFTTKELGKGTGLGLSMVYGIVKQHEGFINVYSEPGRGSTFKIYLPLARTALKEHGRSEPVPVEGGTETVLLAEDNADVRFIAKTVLEEHGYKVIEAVDGEDAVNKFKENHESVRLVILDVVMPKKDGREAFNEIWKIRPDIKAIFISGYTADVLYKKGVMEEAAAFVSKPVSPAELLREVREAIDG